MEASDLEKLLSVPSESENLEFKEAQQQFGDKNLLSYCVALANEGGGYLILGVADEHPRRIVGTEAFRNLNKIKDKILNKIHIRVDVDEVMYKTKRVLIFHIHSRPTGQPLNLDGKYLMRSGDGLVAMTPEKLKSIFNEDAEDWLNKSAVEGLESQEVIDLLDTESYFELVEARYPNETEAVLDRLMGKGLIEKIGSKWRVFNMGAILLAKDINRFPEEIRRKAVRFIIYEGRDKLNTLHEEQSTLGYAAGFEIMIKEIHNRAPQNRIVEEVLRQEIKMFPLQAVRELVANALVHQDFSISGTSVMVEMYSDRLEISNPGVPQIKVERFIDENRSRNERLASIMRLFRICEERGSGIDKVIHNVEAHQLPAPDFRVGATHTAAVLFSYQDFHEMGREDRIRACYQHCCLCYVSHEQMTNSSLRKRFNLDDNKMSMVSTIISDAKKEGLIKPDSGESRSTRYARYIPFWV